MEEEKSYNPFSKALNIALAVLIFAVSCTSAELVPANEVRSGNLNKVIMCPVCPGESIDQSTNDLAIQMRGIVRDQVEEGWSDEQIKQFWVERYGPSVILEPPREGFSQLAWLLPPFGFAAAALALYGALRWMRRPPEVHSHGVGQNVQLSEQELSYYRERIESILDADEVSSGRQEDGDVSRSSSEGAG